MSDLYLVLPCEHFCWSSAPDRARLRRARTNATMSDAIGEKHSQPPTIRISAIRTEFLAETTPGNRTKEDSCTIADANHRDGGGFAVTAGPVAGRRSGKRLWLKRTQGSVTVRILHARVKCRATRNTAAITAKKRPKRNCTATACIQTAGVSRPGDVHESLIARSCGSQRKARQCGDSGDCGVAPERAPTGRTL